MRIYNYAAFYVAEPFSPYNLGAYATPDFKHYNLLRAWKAKDNSFPFLDAHETTYNVRDDSSWEFTLKPRLRKRLNNSKNIVLILSSNTKESRALKEEIEYGVGVLGLPLIIAYPELSNWEIGSGYDVGERAMKYWEKLPCLKKVIRSVPSAHIPLEKDKIQKALEDTDFMIQHKRSNFCWRYSD